MLNSAWTLPNLITLIRIILIPLAFWQITERSDFYAIALISLAAFTDFLDGFIARKFHQESKLGKILDPIADRFFIFFILFGLCLTSIIPAWFLILVIIREAILFITFSLVILKGGQQPEVTFIGKVGAATLMIAIPLIYLVSTANYWHIFGKNLNLEPGQNICFALLCIGLIIYYISGVIYFKKSVGLLMSGDKQEDND